MDIKKIVAVAALVFLAIIGYNYYSSAQSEKARAVRVAETEALKASVPQPVAAPIEPIVDAGVELEPIDDKPNDTDKSEMCNSISEMSEEVMKARLRGVPIQDALGAMDKVSADKSYTDALKGVVIQAYKKPDYQTDEMKERASREFALKQYLLCVDAFDKRK